MTVAVAADAAFVVGVADTVVAAVAGIPAVAVRGAVRADTVVGGGAGPIVDTTVASAGGGVGIGAGRTQGIDAAQGSVGHAGPGQIATLSGTASAAGAAAAIGAAFPA